MKRAYTPWTNRDVETFEQMVRDGHSNKKIAYAIGRSPCAVALRARKYRPKRMRVIEPVPYVLLSLNEIAEYYELGWRLADFDDGFYRFQWPHKTNPLRPSEMRRAA